MANHAEHLDVGAVAVGIGSKEAMQTEDTTQFAKRAAQYVQVFHHAQSV